MKTVRTGSVDKMKLRLVDTATGYVGLILADGVKKFEATGGDPDQVWQQLHDEAGKASPNYFGMDGARTRFLHWFAGGFYSPAYLADERNYKMAAKTKLDTLAPLEKAATGSGYGEAILSAYRATNLLYPVEKTRLQKLLRGADATGSVRAAARFALGEAKSALPQMEKLLRPHDNAKWTVVSYLPFLWRPDAHFFLKPEVTKDFASRVGHPFAHEYEPALRPGVYESLIDLAASIQRDSTTSSPATRSTFKAWSGL